VARRPFSFQNSTDTTRGKKMVAEALLNDQWIRDVMHDLNMHLIDELVKLWGLIEDL
jgi:hypothetical protein